MFRFRFGAREGGSSTSWPCSARLRLAPIRVDGLATRTDQDSLSLGSPRLL